MSGLELVEHLSHAGLRIPVICMTAFADVPMAVRAMKAGAREFVEKPFTAQTILDAVRRALRTDEEQRTATANWEDLRQRMSELTDKERESLAMILEGAPNKVIAARLSITERAVEMRRASLMKKLHAGSFAELVRIATQYELVAEDIAARSGVAHQGADVGSTIQFSTRRPGTASKSVSRVITVQSGSVNAIAASMTSTTCIGRPRRRSSAEIRP